MMRVMLTSIAIRQARQPLRMYAVFIALLQDQLDRKDECPMKPKAE